MSISVLTLKASQLLSPTQRQVIFDPNTEVNSIWIPSLKTCQFSIPPDMKTKLASIQTPKQVSFDPPTNQVKYDPAPKSGQLRSPHWNHVYCDHSHNQINFDANNKTMPFSGRVTLRVIRTYHYMFLWYNSNTRNIIPSTNSCCSWRFNTTVKLLKCCESMHFFCNMIYARLRGILLARRSYVPFLLYVMLLGVIDRS